MAGAIVGALIVGICATAFSWHPGREPKPAAFDAPAGSCLNWQRDGTNMVPVDCAVPHLFEVAGAVPIPGEGRPAEAALQQLGQSRCATMAERYLAKPIDPNGRYSVGALSPTVSQWDDGDHSLQCGLRVAAASKKLLPTKGSVRTSDQSDVAEPGTCIGLTKQGAPGDPVDCGGEHAFEIVGTVDLKSLLGTSSFPSESKQQNALISKCQSVANSYTGGRKLSQYHLSLTWDTLAKSSWDAGSHLVNCKVGQTLSSGRGLQPVTGSIAKAPSPGH